MKFVIYIIFSLGLISCSSSDNHKDEQKHKKMEMGMENSEHWNAPAKESDRKNPVTSDKESIMRGSMLYQKNCASCHGALAKGDGPAGKALKPKPADLSKMAGMHPDGDFFWKITNGRGAMPPWKNILTENQVWDVVNFIQSLSNNAEQTEKESEHGKHSH